MSIIRITKQFNFEMAHALFGYDGACKNIHGHSYILFVTIKGKPINESHDPKNGMVMDFSDLKKIVMPILNEFDHATVLNANSPHKALAKNNLLFDKLSLVDYQPTCENLLIDIAKRIHSDLPSHIILQHLKLHETPTSYAEWSVDDNK